METSYLKRLGTLDECLGFSLSYCAKHSKPVRGPVRKGEGFPKTVRDRKVPTGGVVDTTSGGPWFPHSVGIDRFIQNLDLPKKHQRCWEENKDLIIKYLDNQTDSGKVTLKKELEDRVYRGRPKRPFTCGLTPFSQREMGLIRRLKRVPRLGFLPVGTYFVNSDRYVLNMIESLFWMYRYMMYSLNSHIFVNDTADSLSTLYYFRRLAFKYLNMLNTDRDKKPKPLAQVLSTLSYLIRRGRKTKKTHVLQESCIQHPTTA